jgi:uncharacterized protein YaaN involved in tellurite resistance
MSDPKSDASKQLQIIVESIATKINNSPVLNGGFDKMMVIVEHIQEKQQETGAKVDKIHEGLYSPDDGLYARVRMVENVTADFAKKHAEHITNDEKNMKEISENLKKLATVDEELVKKVETTTKLKKIAGDDLEKLESVIKVKSAWGDIWSKAAWLVVGGTLAAIGKAVWELVAHR